MFDELLVVCSALKRCSFNKRYRENLTGGDSNWWTLSHTIRTARSLECWAVLKSRCGLQQVDEFAHGNAGLSKNRRKGPFGEFPVFWDNHDSAILISEFHVTTSLADFYEAHLFEGSDGLLTRYNG
jgi:hypothetical protein